MRAIRMASDTLRALAAEAGVERFDPLLDPGFLAACTSAGGLVGPIDRTEALERHFADLLPPAVLRRRSKSCFNRAAFGARTRAFVESFSGDGFDPRLVDAAALGRTWAAPEPNALSFAQLQACWLAGQLAPAPDSAPAAGEARKVSGDG